MPRCVARPGRAVAGLLGLLVASTAGPVAAASCPTFRIGIAASGATRVAYADLAAAGLAGTLPARSLALAEAGRPVPIWIEDGGDGRFGPGDSFELVARGSEGAVGAGEAASPPRIFVLSCAPGRAARLREASAHPAVQPTGPWLRREHLEQDRILVRLKDADARAELWFWRKLASTDAAPVTVPLDLSGLAKGAANAVAIRVRLRGWSQPATPVPGLADHRVEVSAGGEAPVAFEWRGEEARTFELPPIPTGAFGSGAAPVELSIRVPPRQLPDGTLFADVSLLDWIDLDVPHTGRIGAAPIRLEILQPGPQAVAGEGPLLLYGDDGTRVRVERADGAPLALSPAARAFDLVPAAALGRPASVEIDRPSAWRSARHGADLLIVGPASLLPALAPLVERRRAQGLRVAVVDVQDVYDEWSGGNADPRAIQAFVAYAFRSWRRPAPRYLLLAGDASWDDKNPPGTETEAPDAAYQAQHGTAFAHVPATPVSGPQGGRARNLVPTWSYPTGDGHAAGDNFFADVDGDLVPDLAVGRFPVVSASEVAGIVDKIRRWEEAPLGSWRREATFVTTEDPGWQLWADDLAERAAALGFATRKVYAPKTEAGAGSGAEPERTDVEAVAAALGEGGFLLHFVGHGGRFVWRTGPPDWQRQRDLFNLDDLERLPETDHPPIVLSMTCYSAPFDHPSADSIGEKLLRLPGRGAIAVLAAAWRISPTQLLSQIVVGEFLSAKGGDRLGDVLLRAKKRSFNRDFLEQYNLLGDPSLPLSPRP